jgi:hypothetical protein
MTSPIDKRNRLLAEEREKLRRSGDPYAPLDGEVFDQEQLSDIPPPRQQKGLRKCVGCQEEKEWPAEFSYHGEPTMNTCRACQRDKSRQMGKWAPRGVQLPEGSRLGGML